MRLGLLLLGGSILVSAGWKIGTASGEAWIELIEIWADKYADKRRKKAKLASVK